MRQLLPVIFCAASLLPLLGGCDPATISTLLPSPLEQSSTEGSASHNPASSQDPDPSPSPSLSPSASPSPTPSPSPSPTPSHEAGTALLLSEYPWGGKEWAGQYSDGTQRYVFVKPQPGAKWQSSASSTMPIKGHIWLYGSSADDFYFETTSPEFTFYFPYTSPRRVSCTVRFWRTFSSNTIGYGNISLTEKTDGTWELSGSLQGVTFRALQKNINPNPDLGVE